MSGLPILISDISSSEISDVKLTKYERREDLVCWLTSLKVLSLNVYGHFMRC